MMLLDEAVFQAAKGTASLGNKVYPFGRKPATATDPYCVWQVQGGSPENYLAGRPDIDYVGVQFDVYGTTAESVRTAAMQLRDKIELKCHIVAWIGESRDDATERYRFTFSADWWVHR